MITKKFYIFLFFIFLFFTSCSNKNFYLKKEKINLNEIKKIKNIKTKNFYGYKIPTFLKIIWIKEYLSFQVYLKYKNYTVIKVNLLPYFNNFIKSINVKYKLNYILPYYTFDLKKKSFFDNVELEKNLLIINNRNKIKKIIQKRYIYVIINNKNLQLENLKFYLITIPLNLKNKIINFNNLLLYIKNFKKLKAKEKKIKIKKLRNKTTF